MASHISRLFMGRARRACRAMLYPLMVTAILLLFVAFWRLAELPNPEELAQVLERLFVRHGVWIVGLAALIEGIAIVNLYAPGSLVILVGVTGSIGRPGLAASMVAVTMLGFALAALMNYAIGYWGFHRLLFRIGGKAWFTQAQSWHSRYGFRALLIGYAHPNAGALLALACGNARYPFTRFIGISGMAILVWNTAFGFVAYRLGPSIQAAAANIWPVVVFLLLWIVFSGVRELSKPEEPVTGQQAVRGSDRA